MRIDPLDPALTAGSPDRVSKNGKYRIPQTNPFIGQAKSVAEIYLLGLRNPFKFSFDANLDQLIIGDVGQNNIEEVNWEWRAIIMVGTRKKGHSCSIQPTEPS